MLEDYQNILLDRDGTVIEERHYLADPDQVQLIPGAASAMRILTRAGCQLFLVTNQSGIGRSYFSRAQYAAVEQRLLHLLREEGVELMATVMCPHAPIEVCDCRKPLPGLWEDLRAIHGLDPNRSIMIGDKTADIRFARAAGLKTAALVLTGHGRKTAESLNLPTSQTWALALDHSKEPDLPDILAPDLAAVVDMLATH
ncbi:D-glycero-alpha-D-manno-heptose-1,7-bisphosphate 7-phosphatase [Desulfonatronum thioautotrophicum]|uniref:D-glycero-alpha-D-manno-heptose-1,7-bisphosphate 7-phosphatase n=1 Tax=Desulfonatronum thioautotrophicum TaxID=617001 RepID=UPI0005EB7E3C|nr:HAD family hydrolase [Desulfonatronum thioautotrophicum]